jgi:hypothetical protein
MRRLVLFLSLLILPFSLSAQYAETFARIAEADVVRLDEAVWLVGSSSGSLGPDVDPTEAIGEIEGLSIRLPAADSELAALPVSNGVLAELFLAIEETRADFWYGILPGRLTAFAYLKREGIFSAQSTITQHVRGDEAVDVVRRYLAFVRVAAGARP